MRITGGRKKIRIGDLLVEAGAITEEELQEALAYQKENGGRIGNVIMELGFISQELLITVLTTQMGIDYIELKACKLDEDLLKQVPENLVNKYKAIPIGYDENNPNILRVAMVDPMDLNAIDDIGIATNTQVEPLLAMEDDVMEAIGKYYGNAQAMEAAEQYRKEMQENGVNDADEEALNEDIENSPIVLLVKQIIESGVRQRASDIHIEPLESSVRVRYRIDGALKHVMTYDIGLLAGISARIKIIGGMDIAEKRKPQDGRITMIVDRKEYDIRVSNLPTVYGEKVVMRLASKEGFRRDKKDLGLNAEDLVKFDNILRNPHGIILVTGPTGSGKSTTLYTALSELASDEVNIVTVEDPVEANVDGVNQVQVNPKADLTFASALRSILRQDPDIIMIGEIRDGETAEIAVKASITGHLVVSTLHTNSTSASIARLIDMGIEPYLLGDSLVGIIAQRLVRRLCECKKSREATPEEKRVLGVPEDKQLILKERCGCEVCGNTGYFGRIGVYEIMPITHRIRNLIAKRANADEITAEAQREGMSTLRQAAAKYVMSGVTSFSEMMKITYEAEDE